MVERRDAATSKPLSFPDSVRQGLEALTPRERELVEALVDGATTDRELVAVLGIGRNTLKYHFRNVLAKLGLSNRTQVVAHVLRRRFAAAAASAQGDESVQVEQRAGGHADRAHAREEQKRHRMPAGGERGRLDQEPGDEEATG